jgi:hypothetical protein
MEQPCQLTGHLGHNILDRTTRKGQLGQDSRDGTVSTDWPTGQPGQVSLERTEMEGLPGNESGFRRAVDQVAWAGQPEQEDSWDRTAGT